MASTPAPSAPATAGAAVRSNSASTPSPNGNHPKVKSWWHSLTSHSSGDPDTGGQANGPSAMHQRIYVPRHADRDARLAVPLADRKASRGRVTATKSPALVESLAVHPNQQVAMARLKSYTSSKAAKLANRSAGASATSSLQGSGAGMESVGESEDAEAEGAAPLPSPSAAAVARLSRATPPRVRSHHQRFYSDPSGMAGSEDEVKGGANSSADLMGASSPASPRSGIPADDDDPSVSGQEVRRRLHVLRQQDVARKLQTQLNPSKGKASVVEMARSQSQPQRSTMPPPSRSVAPAPRTASPTASSSTREARPKSILVTSTKGSHRSIRARTATFHLPSSPSRERTGSSDSESSPFQTSAETSDAELDLTLSSSATSVEDLGCESVGEGEAKGMARKEEVVVDDDWAMEVAKAL